MTTADNYHNVDWGVADTDTDDRIHWALAALRAYVLERKIDGLGEDDSYLGAPYVEERDAQLGSEYGEWEKEASPAMAADLLELAVSLFCLVRSAGFDPGELISNALWPAFRTVGYEPVEPLGGAKMDVLLAEVRARLEAEAEDCPAAQRVAAAANEPEQLQVEAELLREAGIWDADCNLTTAGQAWIALHPNSSISDLPDFRIPLQVRVLQQALAHYTEIDFINRQSDELGDAYRWRATDEPGEPDQGHGR